MYNTSDPALIGWRGDVISLQFFVFKIALASVDTHEMFLSENMIA